MFRSGGKIMADDLMIEDFNFIIGKKIQQVLPRGKMNYPNTGKLTGRKIASGKVVFQRLAHEKVGMFRGEPIHTDKLSLWFQTPMNHRKGFFYIRRKIVREGRSIYDKVERSWERDLSGKIAGGDPFLQSGEFFHQLADDGRTSLHGIVLYIQPLKERDIGAGAAAQLQYPPFSGLWTCVTHHITHQIRPGPNAQLLI